MDGLSVRLFVGCGITAELKAHLKRSQKWKEASIGEPSPTELVIVRYSNKEYIGRYAKSNSLSLEDILQMESEIRTQLADYCPKIVEMDQLPIYAFAQLFIS